MCTALKTLWINLPTYLIIMLASVQRLARHLRILSEHRPGKRVNTTRVFDLVNCGPRSRFRTLTGYTAHNCLGFSYGMGPKKFVKQAYDAGHVISLANAKTLYRNYWELFKGIRSFADGLTQQVERDGYVVNPFGYRLTPKPHNAFNAFIQSSVSGIMHVLTAKVMAAAPYAVWITCIHDELVLEVPDNKVEDLRRDLQIATDSLNDDLGWTIKIRTGFAPGRSWFEAK